ncbi:MAG TPA: hypothetical protein VE988_02070, partial [Gemmataceae bacterium]|nr:hypothetical protein [Gemmataceae bacterium]
MRNTTVNQYPRGTPYQAPRTVKADSRKPAAASRKYWFISCAAALLIVGIAAGFIFANRGSAPATVSNDASPKTPNDRMLETLGSLSAAHLYQSYLNIGMLADAVEKEGYSQEQANNMLATVVSLMNVVDKQLDKLAKADLGAEEKNDVERIRELSGLLRVQVAALRAYWLTGQQEQATRYQAAREKAWTALSEV